MLRSFLKGLVLLLLSGLGLLPSSAEPKKDLLETLTIDHLRATFPTLGIDQLSKPGRRWTGRDNIDAPDSWLDGLARLKLTPLLEEEIVHLIRSSPGIYHQTYRAVVPLSDRLWLEARFHEIRSRPDQALALYQAANPNTLGDREKIALGRLSFLFGDENASRKIFSQVIDWEEFKAEFHVFTIIGKSDKLPKFFNLLRQAVPPTSYRKDIYPRELDYAFSKDQWQNALAQAKADGPLWHLFALHYYGEEKKYEELRIKLQTKPASLPLRESSSLPRRRIWIRTHQPPAQRRRNPRQPPQPHLRSHSFIYSQGSLARLLDHPPSRGSPFTRLGDRPDRRE